MLVTIPFSGDARKIVVKSSLIEMLFELVTACCEWQKLRWQAGDDLLELQQEILLAEGVCVWNIK